MLYLSLLLLCHLPLCPASLTNITYFMASLNSYKPWSFGGRNAKGSRKTSLPGSNILALSRAVRYQLLPPALIPACGFSLMELNGKIYLQTLGKVLADHA